MTAMLNPMEAAPVQWANLLPFDATEPLNDGDLECLAEVREVLKKHGMRERFGVALLHKHFDLAADEILLETTDVDARVQTIQPVKKGSIKGTIGTIWMLLDGENMEMMKCQRDCNPDMQGNHKPFHTTT